MEKNHSSEISPHCMESEGSLQFSQHPATCSYPDPDESSPHIPFCFFQTQLHSIRPPTPRSPNRYLPSYLTTKILYACIFSPIRATCPAHLTFFDLIILIMFGEEQKPQSLSLCSFLQSPLNLLLLRPCYHAAVFFRNFCLIALSLSQGNFGIYHKFCFLIFLLIFKNCGILKLPKSWSVCNLLAAIYKF